MDSPAATRLVTWASISAAVRRARRSVSAVPDTTGTRRAAAG